MHAVIMHLMLVNAHTRTYMHTYTESLAHSSTHLINDNDDPAWCQGILAHLQDPCAVLIAPVVPAEAAMQWQVAAPRHAQGSIHF